VVNLTKTEQQLYDIPQENTNNDFVSKTPKFDKFSILGVPYLPPFSDQGQI